MKFKSLTLLVLLIKIKIILAQVLCVTYPNANLGVYNSSIGANTSVTITSTCTTTNTLYHNPITTNPPPTISNGIDTVSLTANFYTIDGKNYYLPISSGTKSGSVALANTGTYLLTLQAQSGLALSVGNYTGTVPVTSQVGGKLYYLNIGVAMTIAPVCSISSSGAGFNNVVGGNQTAATGTISSSCSNGVAYILSADGGNSSNILARTIKKTDNSDALDYQLYTDSGYTTVWGDGITGSNISLTGTGSTQTTTIYGKVPPGRYNKPGSYADTLNITMAY